MISTGQCDRRSALHVTGARPEELLHAHAQPVLQLIERGEPSLLECGIPQLAENLLRHRTVVAEQVSCVCQVLLFVLFVHLSLRLHVIRRSLRGRGLPSVPGRATAMRAARINAAIAGQNAMVAKVPKA